MLAAVVAVDDGDGAAPVALAGQEPVAESVVDLPGAVTMVLQPGDSRGFGLGDTQAVQELRVDGRALTHVGLAVEVVRGANGAHDLATVSGGEVPIALVLAGDGHDRPGAVGHQYVVGQEDGDVLAGERVDHPTAGCHSPLVECTLGGLAFDVATSGHRCPESVYGGPLVVGGEFVDPWVFRGDHGERHAERGVGSGGVNRERLHISARGPVVVSNG